MISLPVELRLCTKFGAVGVSMLDLLVVTFGDGDFWRSGCLSGDFWNFTSRTRCHMVFPIPGYSYRYLQYFWYSDLKYTPCCSC